jgi:hypothetical protein
MAVEKKAASKNVKKAQPAKAKTVAKKATVKKAPAVSVPSSEPKKETEVKKARKPRTFKVSGFAELQKKEAELEAIKKKTKIQLKNQYDSIVKKADGLKAEYKQIFKEDISTASKGRKAAVGKSASPRKVVPKPITLDEVQTFIDHFAEGQEIKLPGRRPLSIAKIKAAYIKAKTKDAESVLALLK